MRTVLTLLCALVAAHSAAVAADCPLLKSFDTTLDPVCDSKDIYIKWPNYANQYTYYTCTGINSPKLVSCPRDEVFIYVLQQCGPCSEYIPPVPCSQLKTQNPPVCVPIGASGTTSSSGYPTPNYPSTVTTAKTTKTTKTTATTATTRTTRPVPTPPGGSTVPTPPVVGSSTASTGYPGPPSPATNDPNVPTPPTPEPTPQLVEPTPQERPALL